MRFASVVVDIATRQLNRSFDYRIPPELASDVQVGTTVLVSFSGRVAIGYVIALSDSAPAEVAKEHLLPIKQVLAKPAFDEVSARIARWIAEEYACPLALALRLFLAPGQKMKVKRQSPEAPWELVQEKAGPIDSRWVSLSDEGRTFVPKKHAFRQKELLAALASGPQRMAELAALVPGAHAVVGSLAKRKVVSVEFRRQLRATDTTSLSSARALRPSTLTEGQRSALEAIEAARQKGQGDVVLVDGITGSGKTEVYLAAIERCLAAGQSALVLVPEISLTAQTVGRFRSRFGEDVAVLHSRLSTGERFDQWDLARSGLAHVVVGARSALFAPVHNLGLIVIDEEHEGSYKQDSAPRYHAREVAAYMARERGCALVLGSATPSLETLMRCQRGSFAGVSWTRKKMNERPGTSELPSVEIVDMTQQFAAGRRSFFSLPLTEALEAVIRQREKAVLLLNRRGFARFLMCRECGSVPECPHCSTALTYHERTHELVCHSCGRTWPQRSFPDPSARCPRCGSRYMGAYGIGTQRVEDELYLLLDSLGEMGKGVEIIRMDADTTRTKGAHQALLEQFDRAESAILLGTQMIAKGLDFPEVTLVGVINADTTLKLPDFRAAERTYDLLEQVAGRAGRGNKAGRVIIQSYWASHPAIASVATHQRAQFVQSELAERAEAFYPPFARLANITVWGTREAQVMHCVDEVAKQIHLALKAREDGAKWVVLGPAACVKARVKDRFRRHILVKSPLDSAPGALLAACVEKAKLPRGISVAIDIDATDLM